MEYRLLGNTGLKVSARSLGTMMFGHGNTDEKSCKRILDQALDAGIILIDTADHYADGRSEEIVGRALGSRRNDVILSSKVHFPVGEAAINQSGNSRYWIFKAVEGSLRRLGVDHIDILHIHHRRRSTTGRSSRRSSSPSPGWPSRRAFPCAAWDRMRPRSGT